MDFSRVGGAAVIAIAAVCSGCSGTDDRSAIYDACKEAVFHDSLGLEPQGRDAVRWPPVRSPSVLMQRRNDSYTVKIRGVTVDTGGQNTNAVVDCTAVRRPNGRWRAHASVES